VLVIHGRNLYPHDIEHEVRLQHPELAGQAGAAFTVVAPEEKVVVVHEVRGRFQPDRLLEISRGVKATVAREFGVSVGGVALLRPGSVLRTTSGKIRRAAMRELFLGDELSTVYEHLDPRIAAVRSVDPVGTRRSA
jgi:acyl-CoA synthetase (AMP-forming)/AMP-acid ligase II